jgi:ribonuclease Z
VHDSTFAVTEQDRAFETGHSTAKEAAEVAKAAGVVTLVLTHLSSRRNWKELRDEAREVFPGALLPRDLDMLVVPYPDKGIARLERV